MTVTEVEAPAPAQTEITVADVLERAADLLGEYHWCRGHPANFGEDYYCAGFAIGRAQNELGYVPPDGKVYSFEWAADYLGVKHIPKWNDTPGRTREEVVARLREAARNAR